MEMDKTFEPPSFAQQRAALAKKPGEKIPHQYNDWSSFDPIPIPKGDDWLAFRNVKGQTVQMFTRKKNKKVPTASRKTIYITPFGEFKEGESPSLDLLEIVVSTFFGLPSVVSPILKQTSKFHRRTHMGHEQFLTADIMNHLKLTLPSDAFCVIAISMSDLYPREDWNFVFGKASLSERVGVFSFARFSDSFWGTASVQDSNEQQLRLLKRSIKVSCHEIGHMFGLKHCIYFNCLMRGSNNLEESDSKPFHLCPICLRKLQTSLKFKVLDRYERLAVLLSSKFPSFFESEVKWYRSRIASISDAKLKQQSENQKKTKRLQ